MSSDLSFICSVARSMLRRLPPCVELGDLISDAYLGLRRARSRFDRDRCVPFEAYARRRMVGAIRDGLRQRDVLPRSIREQSKPAPMFKSLPNSLSIPDRTSERMHADDSVRAVLRVLPVRLRVVIWFYYFRGLSMKQIARCMRVSESAISQNHSRAIRLMRRMQKV